MIGVIGGAGVAATNKLCQIIEEHKMRNGAFRDMHHPVMLIWQATQVQSRIRNLYKHDNNDIVYIDSFEVVADYIYQNSKL